MVQVVAYDPAWPALAEAAIAELPDGLFAEVEHIGSTAVPGLAAKPVIDLMAAVPSVATVPPEPLVRLGYRQFDGFADRLLFVRESDGVRTHHLHVVDLAGWPTRNQRILRDHLRAHPADAARYGELKRSLAATADGDAYTTGKTALIQELVDRARAERGLPPVPVWEV